MTLSSWCPQGNYCLCELLDIIRIGKLGQAVQGRFSERLCERLNGPFSEHCQLSWGETEMWSHWQSLVKNQIAVGRSQRWWEMLVIQIGHQAYHKNWPPLTKWHTAGLHGVVLLVPGSLKLWNSESWIWWCTPVVSGVWEAEVEALIEHRISRPVWITQWDPGLKRKRRKESWDAAYLVIFINTSACNISALFLKF